ncbi:hypothetical protein J5U46_06930 [Micromonospora tulbaghiae]|uniref:Uncharacterized protein n=2 Tax=Micromonospora tulbaghiae TaxID=479978 RepID=A0AAW4JEU7_9ACTN|nr:hypothetical protein [Micromonospora tulbaghiae]SCE77667.1 hypothetical protein GA0070562_2608 [Micromonospora tulbaghiae]
MRGDDGMHARRSGGPADRAESDRLLDAARAGTPPGADADPLTRLLSAAAGPAAPGEVAGEERALAAFRAARATDGTAPTAAAVAAPRPRRRLRIAAALSGLAATAVAGVAFAAVRLDRPPEPVVPPATTAGPTGAGPTGTGPGVTGPSRPAPGTPAGDASGAASPPAPTPASSGTPSAEGGPPAPAATSGRMAGHCRAYLAKPERQREKALTTPGFADLVAAAGGPEQVESYCRNLVGAPAEGPDDEPEPERPGPRTDD